MIKMLTPPIKVSNIAFACAALLMALSVVGVAAEVPTIVVGPGESYVVGDVGAAQGGNGSHVYDLRGGSTLVITNCAAGGGTFWNVIYATNGLATVDCTQMSGKVLTIMRGVRSYGRGAVRVKSANGYVKVSQETTPCIWDAEDFQVLKTDGTPWPDGGSLQLMSRRPSCTRRRTACCRWRARRSSRERARRSPGRGSSCRTARISSSAAAGRSARSRRLKSRTVAR